MDNRNKPRVSWNQYFLEIARQVATRATCVRAQVGCVFTRDHQVLATGYNGSPRGVVHCIDEGCEMEDGHCVRTVHSEVNAIAQAARRGVALEGATLFCTHCPCYACAKVLKNLKLDRVFYLNAYRPDPRVAGLLNLTHCTAEDGNDGGTNSGH